MTKPNYTPEIRERAVQLLIESEKDYPSTWAAITAIAPKIGCTPERLCCTNLSVKAFSAI